MKTGIMVIVVFLACWLITSVVKKALLKAFKIGTITGQIESQEQKTKVTIVKLVVSMIQYLIWFFVISLLFANLGTQFITLATGFGVTVGFLIRDFIIDIITGFLVLGERQFQVGDVIKIGEQKGTVIEIGMRTTSILLEDDAKYICANRLLTGIIIYPHAIENKENGDM
ncbi:MAG: mechanosensitive ion channel family protein [Culicoidibacterales bacterium]